jgi:hypothetical protein
LILLFLRFLGFAENLGKDFFRVPEEVEIIVLVGFLWFFT